MLQTLKPLAPLALQKPDGSGKRPSAPPKGLRSPHGPPVSLELLSPPWSELSAAPCLPFRFARQCNLYYRRTAAVSPGQANETVL